MLIAAIVGGVVGLRKKPAAPPDAPPAPTPPKPPPPVEDVIAPPHVAVPPTGTLPAFSSRKVEPPDQSLAFGIAGAQTIAKLSSTVASAASTAGISGVSAAAVAPVAIDAALLAIAGIDAFGGDFAIPTYAALSPEFDATTAAGQFHARQEALLINDSLSSTLGQAGGTVKFRTSGVLSNDFALGT